MPSFDRYYDQHGYHEGLHHHNHLKILYDFFRFIVQCEWLREDLGHKVHFERKYLLRSWNKWVRIMLTTYLYSRFYYYYYCPHKLLRLLDTGSLSGARRLISQRRSPTSPQLAILQCAHGASTMVRLALVKWDNYNITSFSLFYILVTSPR